MLSIKDISDTEKCLYVITKMKKLKDNFKIFEYIKTLDYETISQFENYSKIYLLIIELDDTDDDILDNVYDKVFNIIRDAIFNIYQNI